jgi:hypothetical protein
MPGHSALRRRVTRRVELTNGGGSVIDILAIADGGERFGWRGVAKLGRPWGGVNATLARCWHMTRGNKKTNVLPTTSVVALLGVSARLSGSSAGEGLNTAG